MNKRVTTEYLRNALFDFAAEHPEGFTSDDFRAEHDVDFSQFHRGVKALRDTLGAEGINLVADPSGTRGPWIYRLVDQYSGSEEWVQNRLGDSKTRLVTLNNVISSVVNATDPSTYDGKVARLMQRATGRLLEDIDALQA